MSAAELSEREVAILLDLLIGERNRIRRSKAKDWRPSTRVMAIADLDRISGKLGDPDTGL